MNGGSTTSDALEALDDEDASMVVDWVEQLPCWAQVRVGERDYILTHAGIDPWRVEVPAAWDEGSIERLMAAQRPDDRLWIRDDFWTSPTGLVNERGEGPIVIAGHTPTPYLTGMLGEACGPTRNADGLAQMVKVGASGATGGVADRCRRRCRVWPGPRPSPGRRRLFLRAYPSWRVAKEGQGRARGAALRQMARAVPRVSRHGDGPLAVALLAGLVVEDVLRHGGAAGLVDVHAAEGARALVEGVGDHAAV